MIIEHLKVGDMKMNKSNSTSAIPYKDYTSSSEISGSLDSSSVSTSKANLIKNSIYIRDLHYHLEGSKEHDAPDFPLQDET